VLGRMAEDDCQYFVQVVVVKAVRWIGDWKDPCQVDRRVWMQGQQRTVERTALINIQSCVVCDSALSISAGLRSTRLFSTVMMKMPARSHRQRCHMNRSFHVAQLIASPAMHSKKHL